MSQSTPDDQVVPAQIVVAMDESLPLQDESDLGSPPKNEEAKTQQPRQQRVSLPAASSNTLPADEPMTNAPIPIADRPKPFPYPATANFNLATPSPMKHRGRSPQEKPRNRERTPRSQLERDLSEDLGAVVPRPQSQPASISQAASAQDCIVTLDNRTCSMAAMENMHLRQEMERLRISKMTLEQQIEIKMEKQAMSEYFVAEQVRAHTAEMTSQALTEHQKTLINAHQYEQQARNITESELAVQQAHHQMDKQLAFVEIQMVQKQMLDANAENRQLAEMNEYIRREAETELMQQQLCLKEAEASKAESRQIIENEAKILAAMHAKEVQAEYESMMQNKIANMTGEANARFQEVQKHHQSEMQELKQMITAAYAYNKQEQSEAQAEIKTERWDVMAIKEALAEYDKKNEERSDKEKQRAEEERRKYNDKMRKVDKEVSDMKVLLQEMHNEKIADQDWWNSTKQAEERTSENEEAKETERDANPCTPKSATPKDSTPATPNKDELEYWKAIRGKEADECKFHNYPNAKTLEPWIHRTERIISTGSGLPNQCLEWIMVCHDKSIKDIDDPKIASDGPLFESWGGKVATGLQGLLTGLQKKKVQDLEIQRKKLPKPKFLNGRQMYWMILQDVEADEDEKKRDQLQRFIDLKMMNDNLEGFCHAWEQQLLNMKYQPDKDLMELQYINEIERSSEFRPTMTLMNTMVAQGMCTKDYDTIKKMVDKHIKDKHDNNNNMVVRGDRHRGGTGAPAQGNQNNYGMPVGAVPFSQADCPKYYWNGRCPRITQDGWCSYPNHTRTVEQDGGKFKGPRGNKGKGKGKRDGKQNRGNPNKPNNDRNRDHKSRDRNNSRGSQGSRNSQGSRHSSRGSQGSKGKGKSKGTRNNNDRGRNTGKSPSRPRSGKSPSGKSDRPPCRDYMKGNCTKTNCDYWHPPDCKFYAKGDCKLGGKCSLRHLKGGKASPARRDRSPHSSKHNDRRRGRSPSKEKGRKSSKGRKDKDNRSRSSSRSSSKSNRSNGSKGSKGSRRSSNRSKS